MKLGVRTYTLTEPLVVTGEMVGAGIGRTILDFSAADYNDFAGSGCVVLSDGARLQDLTVIGIPTINHFVPCIKADGVTDPIIESVRAQGSAYCGIFIDGGSGAQILSCQTADSQTAYGYNYGVLLHSTSDALVKDCNLQATRHGCAMGPGAPADGPWAQRNVVIDCVLEGTEIYGGDFHGHVRNSRYERCTMNGMTCGGDSNAVIDCTVTAGYDGRAIHMANLATYDRLIKGCTLSGDNDGIRGLIEIDRSPGVDTVDPSPGGTIRIYGNTFSGTGRSMMLRNRFVDGLPNLIIKDNETTCTTEGAILSMDVSTRWATAVMTNNRYTSGTILTYGAHVTTPTEAGTMEF